MCLEFIDSNTRVDDDNRSMIRTSKGLVEERPKAEITRIDTLYRNLIKMKPNFNIYQFDSKGDFLGRYTKY